MFSLIATRLKTTVLPRRRDLFSFTYSSSMIVRFITTSDSTANNSFAVSYLINTCGVPKDKAVSAPKRVHFESTENPDAVITFFRDNGFSDTHISKIIGMYPALLLSSVDKTLKPKFEFFKSQGITGSAFATVLCRGPDFLGASLDKTLIPSIDFIRSIVHTDANLLALLKRSPSILRKDPQTNLLPNVTLLRAQGVPADNIARLLITQPGSFLKLTSRFSEIVEEVKKMKFDPKQYLFLAAIHGLTCMSKSSLEAKFDVYGKWGLSKDEVQLMFRNKPQALMLSEQNVMSTMNYFVNEMGCTPSFIAKYPTALLLSLNRRIIPRCTVIQILKTKGLIGNEASLDTLLKYVEKDFLKKYVIRFEKEVPELLSIYQGQGR